MRSAANFHPEWGCLAPSQGFIRFICIALAATAVGATSGAVVMNALVEGPGSSDRNMSVSAHALVSNAPVIVAPTAEMTSLVDTMAAAALIAEYTQPKPLAADIRPPAPGATPASTASAVASAHEPSRTASRAIARTPEHTAQSGERPPMAGKAVEKKKDLPRKRHWRTATNARNYRYYDQEFRPQNNQGFRPQNQEFRPSFQPPERRPFVQSGFGEIQHDW